MDVMKVVAAMIVRDGRIMLTQRSGERDYPWHWECPGGKAEESDPDPVYTLRRELQEEVGGLRGDVSVNPIFTTRFEPGDPELLHPITRPFEISFYAVRPLPPGASGLKWQPRLLDVEGAGWFDLDAMRRIPLIPGNTRLLTFLSDRGGVEAIL